MARTGETCRLGSAIKATITEETTTHFALLIHHPIRGLRDNLSEIILTVRFSNFSRLKLWQSNQFIICMTVAYIRREFEVDCVGSL